MAQRRMFSLNIINSARFLKMPIDSQVLYFYLGLRADDDGIVEAYPIMKMLGNMEDNLKILVAKNFVRVLNEDLVSFITDWTKHNLIRADRKVDSIYKNLLLQIIPDVRLIEPKIRADTGVRPRQLIGRPLDGIGKDRLGKVRLKYISETSFAEKVSPIRKKSPIHLLVDYFFELKNWAYKDKSFYKENKIVYARHTGPAKKLIMLNKGDLEKAKECLKKVGEWADSRDLSWGIDTVIKKWHELDDLGEDQSCFNLDKWNEERRNKKEEEIKGR